MQCLLNSTKPAAVSLFPDAANAPTPNKPKPALKYWFSDNVVITRSIKTFIFGYSHITKLKFEYILKFLFYWRVSIILSIKEM